VIVDGPAVVVPADLAGAVSGALDRWLRLERPADPELLRLAAELRHVANQMADGGRSLDGDELAWLAVTQAASCLGVPARTLRRRAAAAQIPARRGADGRTWQVGITTSTRPTG
jgi:hypothetical protein